MTLATLQGMNLSMGDVANALRSKPPTPWPVWRASPVRLAWADLVVHPPNRMPPRATPWHPSRFVHRRLLRHRRTFSLPHLTLCQHPLLLPRLRQSRWRHRLGRVRPPGWWTRCNGGAR